MLEQCFADLLKGLVFDDEVMEWVVDALHQTRIRNNSEKNRLCGFKESVDSDSFG